MVPEQELQAQCGSDWKEEHECVHTVGAEVSLRGSVLELYDWGPFAEEMVRSEPTETQTS